MAGQNSIRETVQRFYQIKETPSVEADDPLILSRCQNPAHIIPRENNSAAHVCEFNEKASSPDRLIIEFLSRLETGISILRALLVFMATIAVTVFSGGDTV
ncbi:hypothetical protein OIU85_007676 [Salix viminalis]|uniref:Uncharacterized protein n=1 Tax=Salix viminalis TaxID=40686 RepID=A0A9Q0SN90_SALVM|nr:hypothetical protein OIU85_007676 [Salix viminalis]